MEVLVRHSTIRLEMMLLTIPTVIECGMLIKPAAGVIATSPTTAPIHVPIAPGLLPLTVSNIIHVKAAAAEAHVVVASAVAARLFAPNADPALNPNHPNQSNPVPSIT